MWPFNNSNSKSGRPIRRDVTLRETTDQNGDPITEAVERESFELSPEGSIDRVKIETDGFYHCGCNRKNPLGGRCGEPDCNRVSCIGCFGRCEVGCQKPLCLEHSFYLIAEDGRRVRMCRECHEMILRQRMLKTVGKKLLSPFVEFKD